MPVRSRTEVLRHDHGNQDDGDFLVRHDIAMAESVMVRTLLAGEVDRYRELRLVALLDSPTAFTATWAEENAMADSAWEARVELSLSGGSAIVVADTDGSWSAWPVASRGGHALALSLCGSRRPGGIVV